METERREVLGLVDGALRRALALAVGADSPPTLKHAMEYAVFPGGARLRPRLCLAVALAGGARSSDELTSAMASIELLHCASLVHDDLPCFDDADIRRGRPSVHAAFGEATAVLCGDALISLAFENLAVHIRGTGPLLAQLVDVLARAVGSAEGLCAGQGWELEAQIDLDQYHRAKTGALFAAATVAGALCAGDCRRDWSQLGVCIGSAYQIADDLRDVASCSTEIGKPTGQDANHGRPNAVAENSAKMALAKLQSLINNAVASVPSCPGRSALQTQIEYEAKSFVPASLLRRVA